MVLDSLLHEATGFRHELLTAVEEVLAEVRCLVVVEQAQCTANALSVSLTAPSLVAEVRIGDLVTAGLLIWHDPAGVTEVAVRLFRLGCHNGVIIDRGEAHRATFPSEAPPPDWRKQVAKTVTCAFAGETILEETDLLRGSMDAILASPWDFLVHLRGQGLITDDEMAAIQRAFDEAGDPTIYGLCNAVTSVARIRRQRGDLQGARRLELLGGRIASGENGPPTGVPSWA